MTAPDKHDVETEAVGWAAIDAALAPLYGDQAPMHYGTLVSWRLGGPDPLQGISAYRRLAPRPHWHFITYGLSDLYEKETTDPAYSGYGFELTFRLVDDALADAADGDPPMWPLGLLQNLARYVFNSGNVFEAGHYLDLNGPIALGRDTAIVAVVFARDPDLAPIDTPNGGVEFLQVVGLTADELTACKRWNTACALELMAPSLPMLATDIDRSSLLGDARIAAALAEGSARDGSSTGFLYLDCVEWTRRKRLLRGARYEVVIGASQVEELSTLLPARLPFDRPLRLSTQGGGVVFEPGSRNAVVETPEGLRVVLDAATGDALARTLRPVAGSYGIPGFDAFAMVVRRSEIRDNDGNLLRTVG